jgi:3-dehydrosphinganine reductase
MEKTMKAIITGGSSGIGYAIANELAGQGADLLLVARDETKLVAARDSISKIAPNAHVHILSFDLKKAQANISILREALHAFGEPDLLVNNAGIAHCGTFASTSDSSLADVFSTDFFGVWHVTKTVLPFLKRGSAILNVSSIAGLFGVYGYTAYGAAKSAVLVFSEVLRGELAPEGIKVSVLCPPDTDTPQLAEENKMKPDETRAIAGNAGLFTPEKVARVALKGVARGKFLIIPGITGKLIHMIYRLAPGLVHALMDGDVKKVRRKQQLI